MIKVVVLAAVLAACGYSRPPDVGPKDSSTVEDAAPDAPPDASRVCAGHADCYADGEVCLNQACVKPDGSCQNAQSALPREPSGALLFTPKQNDIGGHNVRCLSDARCSNGGVICEIELRYFDPDGDVSNTGTSVNLLGPSGELIPPFDTPRIGSDVITVRSCLPAPADNFVGAVQIVDNGGKRSNALCFSGSHAYPTCNPLATGTNSGCAANEKCGWIVDKELPADGHIGCVPEGTVAAGGACTVGAPGPTGFSDCRGGSECVQGRCEGVCRTADPTACGDGACMGTADVLVTPNGEVGTCKAPCHPLTQREGTIEACGSTTANNPNRGCFRTGGQKYVCADIPSAAKGRTDRDPALGVNGSAFVNGCEAGWVPMFFQATGSTTIVCAGTCAPKKTDNTMPANLTGDPAALAKLPPQATPAVGNGRCTPTLKGSETGQGCLFSWWFMLDQNGNLPPSPLNDTTGFCFASRHYLYDANSDGTPERTIPRCDQLPSRTNPPTGCTCQSGGPCSGSGCPDGVAEDWGCYPSTESGVMTAKRRAAQQFRFAYGEATLYRHPLN